MDDLGSWISFPLIVFYGSLAANWSAVCKPRRFGRWGEDINWCSYSGRLLEIWMLYSLIMTPVHTIDWSSSILTVFDFAEFISRPLKQIVTLLYLYSTQYQVGNHQNVSSTRIRSCECKLRLNLWQGSITTSTCPVCILSLLTMPSNSSDNWCILGI